jgi:hypothetical protein
MVVSVLAISGIVVAVRRASASGERRVPGQRRWGRAAQEHVNSELLCHFVIEPQTNAEDADTRMSILGASHAHRHPLSALSAFICGSRPRAASRSSRG